MSQAVLSGIFTGGLYAAFGIGLSLIYGVTRVISAVHGAYVVLGAYIAHTAWGRYRVDPFVLMPLLLASGFILGYGIQRIFINPVARRHILMTITLTFGIDLVVVTIILLVWGADLRSISLSYASAGLTVAGVRLVYVRLAIFGAAVLLALGLDLVLRATEMGRRIRAVSQDQVAAELMGLDGNHYYAMAHGLAAAVAVSAGAFVAIVQPIQPFMGFPVLLIAFAVVVLAGFGSVAPVLVAGILLGVAENLTGVLVGPEFQRLSIFLVYLVVATLRPGGLFGKRFYAH